MGGTSRACHALLGPETIRPSGSHVWGSGLVVFGALLREGRTDRVVRGGCGWVV
jgi:hypothetical protein